MLLKKAILGIAFLLGKDFFKRSLFIKYEVGVY